MKPRNKYQKTIYELHKCLHPLNANHRSFAESKTNAYALISRNHCYCSECNHKWKPEAQIRKKITCPSCNTKLNFIDQTNYIDESFTAIITTVKDFQVIRMLFTKKLMATKNTDRVSKYMHCETMQYWIDKDGKQTTIGVDTYTMSGAWRSNPWNLSSDMSIKDSWRYWIHPDRYYTKPKILAEIRRNGFNGNYHGFAPQFLFMKLLSNSKLETIWKAGQIELFNQLASYSGYNLELTDPRLDKYWPSIKIAIRHNYHLSSDAEIWLDHLQTLEKLSLDLHNPVLVCPDDLIDIHNKHVARLRRIEKKREDAEQIRKIAEYENLYLQQKKKYFNFEIIDNDLQITVLKSVQEFKIESDIHKHCLFSSKYYDKEHSLIMSAKIDGTPIETIEIRLDKMKINQSRGMKNKHTIHHQRIINLVNEALPQLEEIHLKHSKAS